MPDSPRGLPSQPADTEELKKRVRGAMQQDTRIPARQGESRSALAELVRRAEERDKAQQADAAMRDLWLVSKARAERYREALDALVEAEWMVTHDWGGNRDSVVAQARAALREGEE